MMQVTRVKTGGTAGNSFLHLQIMGYFSHPNAVSFHHSTQWQEEKEKINSFGPFIFFFSALLKNWVHQVSELN